MSNGELYTCAHCGRVGDALVVGATVSGKKWGGTFRLCHPDDASESRPNVEPFDCYRLVTVYDEQIGCREPLTEEIIQAFFPDE